MDGQYFSTLAQVEPENISKIYRLIFVANPNLFYCCFTLFSVDGLARFKDESFTASDDDNDKDNSQNCASVTQGPFWIKRCTQSHPNAK